MQAPPASEAATSAVHFTTGGPPTAEPQPQPESTTGTPAGPTHCASSLANGGPHDARDQAALATCQFEPGPDRDIGDRCASIPHPVSLDRLDESIPDLTQKTRRHIQAQWKLGGTRGLNPRAFGLVGDSITASAKFMSPLVHASAHISADVAERLTLGDSTVLARYRDVRVFSGFDSFRTPRAAKVGATSAWAQPPNVQPSINPVGQMLRTQRPAIVVLMYGSNDATTRFVPLDKLVSDYRARMDALIDQLETAGAVVIMNTVPRHMADPSRPDCDRVAGDLSDWRLAVQTNALSAAAAALACEKHLPLIDLRHAFDALKNHGLGPDGVHPNADPRGAGRLDEAGLRCGYNVRNYVTLRMLRTVLLATETSG